MAEAEIGEREESKTQKRKERRERNRRRKGIQKAEAEAEPGRRERERGRIEKAKHRATEINTIPALLLWMLTARREPMRWRPAANHSPPN